METITYTALAKMIHPDLNQHDPHATTKMAKLNSVKNNPDEVHNLAVEWGIVIAPKRRTYTRPTYNNFNFQEPRKREYFDSSFAHKFFFKIIKFVINEKHYSGIIFDYFIKNSSTEKNPHVEFIVFANNNTIFRVKSTNGKNLKVIGYVYDNFSYRSEVIRNIEETPAYMLFKYGVKPNTDYSNEHIYVEEKYFRFHRVLRTTATQVVVFDSFNNRERRFAIKKILSFKK